MNAEQQYRDFIVAYQNMRKLQNQYFQQRMPSILKKCKKAEKELDKQAKELLGCSPTHQQKQLFA